MAERIKLVQGDTRPQITVDLTDESTGDPIDVSDADTVVRLYFRAEGTSEIIATLTASKLPGFLDSDGDLDETSPYDVAGAGGRVMFGWAATPDALSGEPGNYEGEIEITFADDTVQTLYDLLKFKMREQF